MIRAAAKNSDFAAVRGRPGRLRARCSPSCASQRRAAVASTTRTAPGGEGVRLHRALRRGDRQRGSPPRDLRRASRRRWSDAYEKVIGPALRREPPPARGLLRARRRADAPARRRAPAARQGAVVQQPARPQLGARAGRGVRPARVRDRQAQQPVRLRRSRDGGQAGLRTRLRVRPAERLRRRDRASTGRVDRACARGARQAVHRGAARARASSPTRSRCCSEKKNVRLLELAALAGAVAARSKASRCSAGSSCRPATWSRRRASRCSVMTQARAERAGVAGHAVRLEASAATCARTRS